MKIFHESIQISKLQEELRNMSKGYRMACMYVQESPDGGNRSLETILVSQDDVMRFSSEVGDIFPSMTSAMPNADLFEREIYEMSGTFPVGHHDMRPLKLRQMQDNAYPLQKYPYEEGEIRSTEIPPNAIEGDGIFEIPVGPIHAGVIEPGHFRFSVAGEPILQMRVYLGYAYRGIEKMMESPASRNNISLVERISGDNAIAHSLAYLQAVESDSKIPMRAKYIRTILAEMERIHGHLNGISGIALDTALSVPAAKGYAIRERMLRLNDRITGHRLLWGMLRPGGLRRDIDESDLKEIEKEVLRLRFEVDEMEDMMKGTPSFMDRAETTGTLTIENARRYGAVGPIARASGIEYDVRKQHPYEAYDAVGLKVPVRTSGDVYARFMVKKDEILESISIITQCISYMDEGPIHNPVKVSDGFSIGMVESPRGELLHCMHVVNGEIWRYKIRDASFPNWPALESAVLDNIVPDFPLINKSFDLSYSGNDL